MAIVTRREFWDRLELALYGKTGNTFGAATALGIDALYDDLVAQPAPATVTREREVQDAFDEQMRLLRKAARHSEYRGDDDAAEACRWAESRMRHERAAALASAPPAAPPEDARQDTLDRLARAVAKHAAAVTKAGLPHDSDHAIGEYRAILAAGKYPRSPMIYEAASAAPPDQPFTVINEDDGDVTIDFDYANDRVVSIRLGEESSGLSAFVDGESHALCPLDRVPPKVLALLRTSAKSVTLRQPDPPGLVANWRPIETAPKRTDVLAGWADRPHWLPQVLQQDDAGMWFNGEESDYRPPTHWMPLPASPQAKED